MKTPAQQAKVYLACPKRSDSGEKRQLGNERKIAENFRPFFPLFVRLLFSAPLPFSSRLSPLSERLEQAKAYPFVSKLL